MSWQDIAISVSNIALAIAILPIFLNVVFGIKTINVALSITGLTTFFFLSIIGISVISLGAKTGGSMALISAIMWLIIGLASWLKSRKLKRPI